GDSGDVRIRGPAVPARDGLRSGSGPESNQTAGVAARLRRVRAAGQRQDVRLTRKEFLRLASRGATAAVIGPAGPAAARERPPAQMNAQKKPPSGVTRAVVDFITTASFDRLPEKVIVEAKRCLIDGFGVVLGGSTVRWVVIVREYVKSTSGSSEATVIASEPL